MDITNLNPAKAVNNETNRWLIIKEQISSPEMDEQCILDTLEGETDMHDLLLAIEEEIAEKEAAAETIERRIKELQGRKSRTLKTAETLRLIILNAMDRAGIKKIEGPLATLTAKATPRKLTIIDESKIPSDYFVKQDPKLDRKKLADALKDGTEIEGAELDNGSITLQIRRA